MFRLFVGAERFKPSVSFLVSRDRLTFSADELTRHDGGNHLLNYEFRGIERDLAPAISREHENGKNSWPHLVGAYDAHGLAIVSLDDNTYRSDASQDLGQVLGILAPTGGEDLLAVLGPHVHGHMLDAISCDVGQDHLTIREDGWLIAGGMVPGDAWLTLGAAAGLAGAAGVMPDGAPGGVEAGAWAIGAAAGDAGGWIAGGLLPPDGVAITHIN